MKQFDKFFNKSYHTSFHLIFLIFFSFIFSLFSTIHCKTSNFRQFTVVIAIKNMLNSMLLKYAEYNVEFFICKV